MKDAPQQSELARLRAEQRVKKVAAPSPVNMVFSGPCEKVPRNDFGICIPFSVEAGQERHLVSKETRCVPLSTLHEFLRERLREDLQDLGDDDEEEDQWEEEGKPQKRVKHAPKLVEWATAGLVLERRAPNLLKIVSTFDDSGRVFVVLEGETENLPLPKWAVVLVKNARLTKSKSGSSCLYVDHPNQIEVLGVSSCVAFCQERESATKVCNRLMNTQKAQRCQMHEERAFQKTQVCRAFQNKKDRV